MYTEETVCDASEQWMDSRYDCLRAEVRGEQQKLASCEVWARGGFSVVFSLEIMIVCVCVCMYLIYICLAQGQNVLHQICIIHCMTLL